MLNSDQSRIVINLVRKKARILRGEPLKALRLINSLISAGEAQVPEPYLLPFSSILSGFIEKAHFDQSSLPSAVGLLLKKNQRCSIDNLATLERFAARIQREFGAATEETILSGEGAALAVIYQNLGAFPANQWAALLKDGTYANGGNPKELKPPAEQWSEKIQFGNAYWRKPKPALLITLFARHIGDPGAAPNPPMWPHLGTALLVWKDRVGVEEILELGTKLTQREEVERGLAITAHIFPELAKYINQEKFTIPMWERKYAVPIAARRLVKGERD